MIRTHWSRFLAPALLVACVAMAGFAVASLWFPDSELVPDRPSVAQVVAFLTIFLTFPAVGLIVTWKRPENPVGWLFLLVGLSITLNVFGGEYAAAAMYLGWALPFPEILAWLATWQWNVAAGIALPLALLLFPDGRLPGPRWRAATALGVAAAVASTLAVATRPGPLMGYEQLTQNPFAAPGALGTLASAVASAEFVSTLFLSGLALGAIVVRSRRTDAQRQQLKWLLYPVGALILAILSLAIPGAGELGWSAVLGALAAIPVCAGFAILRYRLYDIDVVIRRTLVYGVVVAVLATTYVALALFLQGALSGLTGGGTLPVALSTLAIAALFGPLRARVGAVVDRRFYRSRYDAQQTIEAFAGLLRDQVDADAVATALNGVTRQAVAPKSVSLWLRREARR